jgi:hypothetical protein
MILPIFIMIYMSSTTNISELPNQHSQNNVVMNVKEHQQPVQQQAFAPIPNNQAPQNTMVPQQQMAPSMVPQQNTNLQNRDIPQTTEQFNSQDQIRPNYIPEQDEMDDYIGDEDTLHSMMQQNRQHENKRDRMDMLYDELQGPIMVMVLFFLFQMPFVKKLLLKQVPTLFSTDGNYTLTGYVATTVMFGATYFGFNKAINYMTDMDY